jgi:hypothetical protein
MKHIHLRKLVDPVISFDSISLRVSFGQAFCLDFFGHGFWLIEASIFPIVDFFVLLIRTCLGPSGSNTTWGGQLVG